MESKPGVPEPVARAASRLLEEADKQRLPLGQIVGDVRREFGGLSDDEWGRAVALATQYRRYD